MDKILPETPLALTFMPFEADRDKRLLERVRALSCEACLPGREVLASDMAFWIGRRGMSSMVSLIEEKMPCENPHTSAPEVRQLDPTEIAIANLIANRQTQVEQTA